MTDRELLERAARAAGLRFAANGDDLPGYIAVNSDDWRYGWCRWSPLTDDGDAFRLAVKLGLDIFVLRTGGISGDEVQVNDNPDDHERIKWARERLAADPYAATRRAIVRAAAAMAKGA